uniref:T-complex protein epsilon-SU n=1 Tax=Amorphochlora amoebiformis TaxID=1561963 RepID=A0A0H5BQZ6_9EUKA|nr:T-complex protein epsilon-SU [Amorphochlora amoebiformis]
MTYSKSHMMINNILKINKLIYHSITKIYGKNVKIRKYTIDYDSILNYDVNYILNSINKHEVYVTILKNTIRSLKLTIGDFSLSYLTLITIVLNNIFTLMNLGYNPKEILKKLEIFMKTSKKIINNMSFMLPRLDKSKYVLQRLSISLLTEFSNYVNISKISISLVESLITMFDNKFKYFSLDNIKIITRINDKQFCCKLIFGICIEKKGFRLQNNSLNEKNRVVLMKGFIPSNNIYSGFSSIPPLQLDQMIIGYSRDQLVSRIVKKVKILQVSVVFHQNNISERLEKALTINSVNVFKWMSHKEIEVLSILSGGRIVNEVANLNYNKLGFIGTIRILNNKGDIPYLIIKSSSAIKFVTIVIESSEYKHIIEIKHIMSILITILSLIIKSKKIIRTKTNIVEWFIFFILLKKEKKRLGKKSLNGVFFISALGKYINLKYGLEQGYGSSYKSILLFYWKMKSLVYDPINSYTNDSSLIEGNIEPSCIKQTIFSLIYYTITDLFSIYIY